MRTGSALKLASLAVALMAVAVAASGSSAGGDASDTRGLIRHVAAADGRIAWMDSVWRLKTQVVASGAETSTLYTRQYEELPSVPFGAVTLEPRRLVLAGSRLLWVSHRAGQGSFVSDRVYTMPLGRTTPRLLRRLDNDGSQGSFVTGIAGDDSGMSYAFITIKAAQPDGGGPHELTGGGVVDVKRGALVPGVPPSYLMARRLDRIAVVPLSSRDTGGVEWPREKRVEVRDASTGALETTVSPGAVWAAALSDGVITVMTGGREIQSSVAYDPYARLVVGARLIRYAIPDGRRLGSRAFTVPVWPQLEATGTPSWLEASARSSVLTRQLGASPRSHRPAAGGRSRA